MISGRPALRSNSVATSSAVTSAPSADRAISASASSSSLASDSSVPLVPGGRRNGAASTGPTCSSPR